MRSYGSASVTATYTGPLPGTLCYDTNCQQAAPGYYTAPAEEVIRTWTTSYPGSCPAGYTGSVTVTEQWRTVKYWTPSAGGLSSRGTLTFTSATRDEMVDRTGSRNCEPEPREPPSSTQTTPDTNTTDPSGTPTDPSGTPTEQPGPSTTEQPGPSTTDPPDDTGTSEADWSNVNIDVRVIPGGSQTSHLSQRPSPSRPRATLLPFLPPRQGLW